MVRREEMETNGVSCIHLISDKTTKDGEEVCISTEMLKDFDISRDLLNILDIPSRSITSADVFIKTDYIDDVIYLKLTTSLNDLETISIELDEEELFDALIDCVDNKKVLSQTPYIESKKQELLIQIQGILLNEKGCLVNSSETMLANIEIYRNSNLIATANRFHMEPNISSLNIILCEVIGEQLEGEYDIHFYINDKKIIAKNVTTDRFITLNDVQIGYADMACYRSNLSIEQGDINKFNEAVANSLLLDTGKSVSTIENLPNYVLANNTSKQILMYYRKNNVFKRFKEIDINRYLLECLL